MPTDLPSEPFKVITIKVISGEPPECDLGGVDPWLAQNVLFAVTGHLWEMLPEPTIDGAS